MDAATTSIFGHGLSMLVLAMRMSRMNVEQMVAVRRAAKNGGSAGAAAQAFLRAPYYRSWSRAQLNNVEYAPMLALLCFVIKSAAEKRNRGLSLLERTACLSSVFFSYIFVYAAATQGALKLKNIRPGQGGMSPLRPIGALGRYVSMALLLLCVAKGGWWSSNDVDTTEKKSNR